MSWLGKGGPGDAGEIRALTGLRGVAATLVMVDHYSALDFDRPLPWRLLPHMYVAVDMFMVLSGFVLAMSYEPRFGALRWGAASRLFLGRRIARLYPVYAMMTLICFVLCRLGWLTFLAPDTSVAALLANLVGVQTWLWPWSSLDGPGWSISAEWAANLVFPWMMPKMLAQPWGRANWMGGVAVGVLVASAMLYGELFDVPVSGVVNVIAGPGALGRCVSEFALGIYCWRLRSRLGWSRALSRALSGDLVQVGLLVAMGAIILVPRLDVLFVLGCGAMIVGLSFGRSWLARVLAGRPFYPLGVISYSIYLVHIALLPVRDGLARVFRAHGVAHSWSGAVACSAVLTLGAATLSWWFVERPGQRWLRRVSG